MYGVSYTIVRSKTRKLFISERICWKMTASNNIFFEIKKRSLSKFRKDSWKEKKICSVIQIECVAQLLEFTWDSLLLPLLWRIWWKCRWIFKFIRDFTNNNFINYESLEGSIEKRVLVLPCLLHSQCSGMTWCCFGLRTPLADGDKTGAASWSVSGQKVRCPFFRSSPLSVGCNWEWKGLWKGGQSPTVGPKIYFLSLST